MVNHHSVVNYIRIWLSLVLQKENTGTCEEKGQQSMAERLPVLNYIHYTFTTSSNTFTESYRKIKSHSEDGGRAHHVCLKCKLFQMKETTGGSLSSSRCPKHTAPVLETAKQSVVTIDWKHNRRSWIRQKQQCQLSQQRSSLQAFTKDMIWLSTLQYI